MKVTLKHQWQTLFLSLVLISCYGLTASAADSLAQMPLNPTTKAYSVHWYRDSVEMRALYNEIYGMVTRHVEAAVASQKLKPHTWGVILDVDETVLNNSLNERNNVINDLPFSPELWNTWVISEQATALPGAKAFLDKVHELGGYVNFVTNRTQAQVAPTIDNLKKAGLWYDQVIGVTTSSDKNPRFDAVQQGQAPSALPAQTILAFVGDNIQDFPGMWQKVLVKLDPNDAVYNNFGQKWFLLPDPIYGSWEGNAQQ